MQPLASLKLTVGLMVAAIFLIFFGTLSMAELNEFEATNQIFRTWVAWIKFQYLFPETFFPMPSRKSSGGFRFPGGWIIGGLMVINLMACALAAVQDSGQRHAAVERSDRDGHGHRPDLPGHRRRS